MKMTTETKTISTYSCEICNKKFKNRNKAINCEESHIKPILKPNTMYIMHKNSKRYKEYIFCITDRDYKEGYDLICKLSEYDQRICSLFFSEHPEAEIATEEDLNRILEKIRNSYQNWFIGHINKNANFLKTDLEKGETNHE